MSWSIPFKHTVTYSSLISQFQILETQRLAEKGSGIWAQPQPENFPGQESSPWQCLEPGRFSENEVWAERLQLVL